MKYSTVAVTVAALIAGVVGQGIGDLPECPRNCIFGGTAKTECSIIDIPCSCRDLSYQAQLAECMAKCPADQAAKGAEVGAAICKQAGVEITIPSITSTVSLPPATTSEPAEETEVPTPEPTTTSTEAPAPTETEEEVEEPTATTPAEEEEEDDEEGEEQATTTSTTTPVVPVPTTLISAAPVPTTNTTTNGTVTPPIATATPPTQDEDSGAGKLMAGSFFGVAIMGAFAVAL